MGGPIHNVQYGEGYPVLRPPALRKCYAQNRPRPPPPPLAGRRRLGVRPSLLLAKALEMRKRHLLPRRPASAPGGRPKGTDEVPPVLDGPGIVRSSVRVARLEVQDNAGGVGQSELETQLQEAKQQRQDDSILRAHDSKVESAFGSMKSAHAPRRKLVVSG